MRQPFPKTWWVAEGRLLAGCFPATPEAGSLDKRLRLLLEAGVRKFICLQETDERNNQGRRFPDYQPALRSLEAETACSIEFLRIPIADCTAPTVEQTVTALDAIDDAIAQNNAVYVHCWGGYGRTGTVIGCWLVRHGAMGKEAIEQLVQLRSHDPHLVQQECPQTDAQRDLVMRWVEVDPKVNSSNTL
jgi:hypothetical protein